MKKNLFKAACAAVSGIFLCAMLCSCGEKSSPKIIENQDGSITITKVDEDGKAVVFGKKADGFSNVTVVDLGKTTKTNPITIGLQDYSDKDLLLDFSCDMKVIDKTGSTNEIIWMVNEIDENFPQIYREYLPSGEWHRVEGRMLVHVGANRQFYLSGAGLVKENITVYLKNFKLNISGDGIGSNEVIKQNWLEVPSLKEAYKDIFDYFGLAVTYNEELSKAEIQKGIKYHADYVTMGNEFKPDFLFNWNQPHRFTDFVAEDGNTYKVPVDLPGFYRADACLQICKELGLKMRGHVLVWHSQTPWWFFIEDYGEGDYFVSPEEMNARMEWYIKTVMEHVADWEAKNNNGEHIIEVWDVVNEACSDGVTETNWIRGEDSSYWTTVYEDGTYIVNAFRYANKYAPKDVELVYNDYGCYSPQKSKGILKILDSILAAPDARIDAIGMQSHVNVDTLVRGGNSFEAAVQAYIAKGVNVQITELDIANAKHTYSPIRLKAKYRDFFDMFIDNRKTADKKGIEGVSIWGLIDEGTWLNSQKEHQGYTQYPLLFEGKDYIAKPAFYGVLEAAEAYHER